MQKQTQSICIFCGTELATTKDHVPPRSFFPDKIHHETKLITVPACKSCHDISMKDDFMLRTILTSTRETENIPVVKNNLLSKRNRGLKRSLKRSGKEFHDLLNYLEIVELKTQTGIIYGKDIAFNFDIPIMHRFIERLSRALLWHEFQESYFAGAFGWRLNLEVEPFIYEGVRQFGRINKIENVFAYGITPFRPKIPSWIFANFYGMIEFFIRVSRETEQHRI